MKVLIVVLLLLSVMTLPAATLCAEPFCDLALESGKVVDWLVCMVFAMILGHFSGDFFGNGIVWE